MRTINFRGKRVDDGGWVYGDFCNYKFNGMDETIPCIHIGNLGYIKNAFYQVDPNTVGQFTGMIDKNGKEIYEGDIIRIDSHAWLDWKEFDGVNAKIVYDNGTFEARWKNPDAGKPYPFQNPDDEEDVEAEYVCEFIGNLPNTIEVIGSIYDNPDLLNGK